MAYARSTYSYADLTADFVASTVGPSGRDDPISLAIRFLRGPSWTTRAFDKPAVAILPLEIDPVGYHPLAMKQSITSNPY